MPAIRWLSVALTRPRLSKPISFGESAPAKRGRQAYRRNFQYNRSWGGQRYAIKQVLAIVAEETDNLVVVTVYTFYF